MTDPVVPTPSPLATTDEPAKPIEVKVDSVEDLALRVARIEEHLNIVPDASHE